MLCYKISDPISLYNVKNKWVRELRTHRPDVPVILCGCQSDLRADSATLNHLSKTGRTPVSSDQALAICCEIQAVNYVETSAKYPSNGHNSEAFELCALAAIKAKNQGPTNFKRSPSLNSSLSLFEPMNPLIGQSHHETTGCNNNNFHKTAKNNLLRHSYRYQASLVAPPPLNSPSSFSECDARLSTFSPEPLKISHFNNDPVSTSSENDAAYQSDTNMSVCSFQTFHQESSPPPPAPTAPISTLSKPTMPTNKPQRPTTLFKTPLPSCYSPQTLITPTGDPKKRLQVNTLTTHTMGQRFDSLSELGAPQHPAMVRPNCLTRRTSYRTYQKVPIPVAAPMSPVGSDYSLDLKSPTSSQCFSPVPRLEVVSEDMETTVFEKTYESLKSTCSSQNSSKTSSTASAASSAADLSTYKLRLMGSHEGHLDAKGHHRGLHVAPLNTPTDTEDPNLIKNLNFVSPKSGVYRPLPEGSRSRYKQSCNVM